MKLKKFTALCLCAVLLCGAALTACKKRESTSATADEATVSTTAQPTQQTESTTATVAQTEEETTETAPPATKPTKTTKPTVQSGNSGGNTTSHNSNSNSSSAQSKPVTCVITVDGKDHKVQLGDTLTYTYYVKTPKKIENVQATVYYPGTTLKLLDNALVTDFEEVTDKATLDKLQKELEGVFPVLKTNTIYNAFNHNIILFNATNISGFDFTKGDYLIKLRFEVISGINGAVSTKVEFMDEVGGNPYVDNFKFSKDVEQKESLTQ